MYDCFLLIAFFLCFQVLYRWNINIYRALMDPLASTMKALPAAYKRTFLASIYESEAELLKELLSNEPC